MMRQRERIIFTIYFIYTYRTVGNVTFIYLRNVELLRKQACSKVLKVLLPSHTHRVSTIIKVTLFRIITDLLRSSKLFLICLKNYLELSSKRFALALSADLTDLYIVQCPLCNVF
jgi:hypothetical protein